MTALLELDGVDARYGGVQALHGVSLRVEDGESVAILGANGAGKTSTLRAISGTVRRSGTIVFDGKPIRRKSPEAVARLGIAHVPEGREIYARADGLGEPPHRRESPPQLARGEARLRERRRLLPATRGQAEPAGGDALRR